MSEHYILEGHDAVPVDLMTWARWFEKVKEGRIVKKTKLSNCSVSTVFLGLDHQYGDGPPHIFETLVFEGPYDGDMERCSTWDQAEKMHEEMCARVQLPKDNP